MDFMNDLKEKVAVVTGASGDIGADVALLLAKNGAKVFATYNRRKARIDPLLSQAKEEGLDVKACRLDISDGEKVRSFFSKHFRSRAPDILVNVAGHSDKAVWFKKPDELMKSEWVDVYSVDVIGSFNCTREAARLMKKSGGSIVNFSSSAAIYGHTEGLPYTAAKAALIALTKSLAYVYGPKVRVNAVAPGNIDAGSIKWYTKKGVESLKQESSLRRLGDIREVSNLVLFLASDQSSFITGQTILVDGGY